MFGGNSQLMHTISTKQMKKKKNGESLGLITIVNQDPVEYPPRKCS